MSKILPTLEEEEKIWRQGSILIGVDEVGRGPLAGPVFAAAVAFDMRDAEAMRLIATLGIHDSKKVSEKNRERIFAFLTAAHAPIWWATGEEDEKTIDRINIFKASLSAMRKAVVKVVSTLPKVKPLGGFYKGETFVFVDGRDIIPDLTINQKAIIGGDGKILSIAAASIIAKVLRDRVMRAYAKQYPQYQFEKHKGYGTKLHFELIKKYGVSPIHRRSFLRKYAH